MKKHHELMLVAMLFLLAPLSSVKAAVEDNHEAEPCYFSVQMLPECKFEGIKVRLITSLLDDEITLLALKVKREGRELLLKITDDTTIIAGDRGYVSFEDINFDGHADIAVTTSSGLANLYLDYWVYDPENARYRKIGNFSKFKLDPAKKILRNTVKINAANYAHNTYVWKGYALIRKSH